MGMSELPTAGVWTDMEVRCCSKVRRIIEKSVERVYNAELLTMYVVSYVS